jgi:hypothetical protein
MGRRDCNAPANPGAHCEAMKHAEQIVQASILGLFNRVPMLAGFHVADDLSLLEVEFEHLPGFTPSAELYEEIASALLEAFDEREEALELMRNRTFARTLQ